MPNNPNNATLCREANDKLREARDLLVQAGARRAADKVRDAIASCGGAIRHADLEPFRKVRQVAERARRRAMRSGDADTGAAL